MEDKVLSAFILPCNYSDGFVFDSNNQVMFEVRGWGMLQYLPNADQLQDKMGEMMAKAFNEKYFKK